jgi:hypothetical protein
VVLEARRCDMIINIEPHGYYTTKPEFMARMLAFDARPAAHEHGYRQRSSPGRTGGSCSV